MVNFTLQTTCNLLRISSNVQYGRSNTISSELFEFIHAFSLNIPCFELDA